MDELETEERHKYQLIWTHSDYRKSSPGEKLVHTAIKEMGMNKGDTLLDLGCGTGKCSQRFSNWGADVTAVDFANNCLDIWVDVRFENCCLWDDENMPYADYGFCTDVMEHIPPERVQDTLRTISKHCNKAVFFQVATRPDKMGKLIGETLHLTVKSYHWWESAMEKHWETVNILSANNGSFTALCRK